MRIEDCPGFGFFPSDECLINKHLSKKNSGQDMRNWPILEIDLCAFEPRDLMSKYLTFLFLCAANVYFLHQ